MLVLLYNQLVLCSLQCRCMAAEDIPETLLLLAAAGLGKTAAQWFTCWRRRICSTVHNQADLRTVQAAAVCDMAAVTVTTSFFPCPPCTKKTRQMAVSASALGWALLGTVCLYLCLAVGALGDAIPLEEQNAVAAGNRCWNETAYDPSRCTVACSAAVTTCIC
jgi:hypothetical protein